MLTRIVGNAKLFGALQDLKMSSQQWNTALSVFFVTYAAGGVYVSRPLSLIDRFR